MRVIKPLMIVVFLAVAALNQALASTLGLAGYYIGKDNRPIATTGDYKGLANPNYGKLTLLLNHGDHFHGIGAYDYTGPAVSPTINDTNTNNRVPETFSGEAPLKLKPGSGSLYGDKMVSHVYESEYSNLKFQSIDSLAGHEPGSDEDVLFNSSGGRWNNLLSDTSIGLQLLSISDGLNVGDGQNANLFAKGDMLVLDNYLSTGFWPVFWTAKNAPVETYNAEFRLINLSGVGAGGSGRFYFDFMPAPIPAPAAVWLFGSSLVGFIGVARKRGVKASSASA